MTPPARSPLPYDKARCVGHSPDLGILGRPCEKRDTCRRHLEITRKQPWTPVAMMMCDPGAFDAYLPADDELLADC